MSWLTFETSAITLVSSVLAMILGLYLAITAMRRCGYRRAITLLELVRVAIIFLVLAVLNQPERGEEYFPDEQPALGILWDDSGSMETADVFSDDGSATGPETRRDAIRKLTSTEAWKQFADRFNIVIQPFSSTLETPPQGTDIGHALQELTDRTNDLKAAVLISDGAWNTGKSPIDVASTYRLKKSPIYTICAGSSVPLPDIDLAAMDAPTFGTVGKPVQIPYTIKNTFAKPISLSLRLTVDQREESVSELEIPANSSVSETLLWKPTAVGDFKLQMTVSETEGEVTVENNSKDASINIRQESLQVLVVDTFPRWEYRFLRNALMRDSSVQMSCVLMHPDLEKLSEGRNYLTKIPDSVEELSKFDVIFLGDIGLGNNQLSNEDCQRLKAVVQNHATGLLIMPGLRGHHLTLADSNLSELLPVVFDRTFKNGHGSASSHQLQLTDLGSESLLTKLADSPDANRVLWRELPGFQWYAAVERAKTGASVLAVHATETNSLGRIPLLVTQPSKVGKVMYLGTDGAWRWREGVEDKYHYRFWGQVVRWMAYQRKMSGGKTMRLFYTPERPKAGSTVTLNANVIGPTGEPLRTGNVSVQLIAPSGKTTVLPLNPAESSESWGLFTGQFTPDEGGVYGAKLTCLESGESLDTQIQVQGVQRERIGQPANVQLMAELASISRGRSFALNDDLNGLLRELESLSQPTPQTRRVQLWAHPGFAFLFLFMVTAFWVGRKLAGVV